MESSDFCQLMLLPQRVSDLEITYNARSLELNKEFACVCLYSYAPQLIKTPQLPWAIYCRISFALLLENFPDIYYYCPAMAWKL